MTTVFDDFEKMKERRIKELREVFMKAFEREPEEFSFVEGYLYATKDYGSGKLIVRLKAQEVDKCKFRGWRLDVCYDDEDLIYVFEKYEIVNDKAYKLTVEIYTE